jgi:threonine aldolase
MADEQSDLDKLKSALLKITKEFNYEKFFDKAIITETNLDNLKSTETLLMNFISRDPKKGGRHREMNLKDIKEICKANQIKLSRVVDGKRVAYKKKELMTKLKRKKLI